VPDNHSKTIKYVTASTGLSFFLFFISSELNKQKIPMPSFKSNEYLGDILPKQKRIKPNEIDLSTQEGFNIAIAELKKADDIYRPKLKINSFGQVSYQYYRKRGEPPKSPKELDNLIKNSRENEYSQQRIAQLLTLLAEHRVLVVVGKTRLKGAAGEWDPSRQVIRIAPDSLSKGSDIVLKILNHEAIHVAQSCRNGGINYKPKPMGIKLSPPNIFDQQLRSDVYSEIGEQTRTLESEAYSYEYSSKAARYYLTKYCKAKTP